MGRIICSSLILSLLLMLSCASENTVRYTIASHQGDCVGVAPQKCMLVKKGTESNWEYFYDNIEGFQFEPGYEYVLDIEEKNLENVPADASSIQYIMKKLISKTAKTSENLPDAVMTTEGYQCVGKVLAIESEDIGKGGAAGKVSATVVQVQVSSSTSHEIKQGEIIYCELVHSPKVEPVVGTEYVFKAKYIHPAHAKGVYFLETDVMDLVH